MSELSFLVDLLLEHKLPPKARDAVRARIREVEAEIIVRSPRTPVPQMTSTTVAAIPAFASQAPSMQAIMARNPDLIAQQQIGAPTPVEQQQLDALQQRTPTIIAQTPATAAAMASRAAAIASAGAGKPTASGGKPKF